MSQRSLILFEHTREGAQRFEYFLLGISTALCAYVAQTLQPQKLGWSPYGLEVISLLVLISSIVAGFKRVEAMIGTSSLNHDVVELQDKRARLIKGEASFDQRTGAQLTEFQMDYAINEINQFLVDRQKNLDAIVVEEGKWYRRRKWLLGIGFIGLLGAKILAPYFHSVVVGH